MIPGNIVKIPEQSEHIIRIVKALLSSGSPLDIAIRVESIIFVFHAVVAVSVVIILIVDNTELVTRIMYGDLADACSSCIIFVCRINFYLKRTVAAPSA